MNNRLKQLAEQATQKFSRFGERDSWEKLFAELIVRECLSVVKSNIYGPAGEYDYSYNDKNYAADIRAETIYDEIKYRFGVEE